MARVRPPASNTHHIPPLFSLPVCLRTLTHISICLMHRKLNSGSPQKASAAGTDGGWIHSTPLKTRYSSPTGLMSFDGDSAWFQYDPHVVVPKEWGKQSENWIGGLRDIGDISPTGPSWKHTNFKRWPLNRVPKYDRTGIEVNL